MFSSLFRLARRVIRINQIGSAEAMEGRCAALQDNNV